jgi:hypothetical protein
VVGVDSVVLVTKNKDGSFATQGDINKLKDNYKVKITGHVKGIGDDATMEGNTQQKIFLVLPYPLYLLFPSFFYLQALYHLPLIHPHRSYQHILYDPRLQ